MLAGKPATAVGHAVVFGTGPMQMQAAELVVVCPAVLL